MEQKNDFLGRDPIGRLLWRMSLPAIVAQLINLLYNLVDRVYIGHMPEDGALALTGVGVCLPIIMIVSAFAALVSNGGAPRASMAMGKGDYDEAEAYWNQVLAQNANCGFCTACFTGEYAVKPDEVLSTDIHERHLNDRPKDEKKLGE